MTVFSWPCHPVIYVGDNENLHDDFACGLPIIKTMFTQDTNDDVCEEQIKHRDEGDIKINNINTVTLC